MRMESKQLGTPQIDGISFKATSFSQIIGF